MQAIRPSNSVLGPYEEHTKGRLGPIACPEQSSLVFAAAWALRNHDFMQARGVQTIKSIKAIPEGTYSGAESQII